MSASKKKRMGSHRRSLNTNVQETPEVSGTAKSPPVAQGKPKEDTKADLSLSPDSAAQSEIPVREKKIGSQRAKEKQQFKDFTTTESSHKPREEVGENTIYLPPPVSDEMDILGFKSESLQKIDESLERTDTSMAQKSDMLLSDEPVNVDISPKMQPISSKSHGSGIEDSDVDARSDWLLSNVQSKIYLPKIERAQEGVLSERDQAKEIPSIPEASFATGVTGESTCPLELIEQEEISNTGSHDTNNKHSSEEVGHITEKPVCQESHKNTLLPVASIRKLGSSRRKKERKNEELQDQGDGVAVETNAFNVIETTEITDVQNSLKVSLDFLGDVASDVKDEGQLEVHTSPKEETGSFQINKDNGISVVVETNANPDSEEPQVAPVASLQSDITVNVKDVTAADSQLIVRKLGSSRRAKGRKQDNDEAKQDEKSEKENIPDKTTEVEPMPNEQNPETTTDNNIFNESVGGKEVDESFIQQVHNETKQHLDDTLEGNITTDISITSVKTVVQEPTVQSDPFQNIFDEGAATTMTHQQSDNAISDAKNSPEPGTTLIQVSQESSTEQTETESAHPYGIFSPPNEQVNLHQITFLDDSEMHEEMDNSLIKTDEASQTHQVQEREIIQTDLKFKHILKEKIEAEVEDITTDQFFKTTEITSSFEAVVQEQPLQRPVKHVTFQNDDNHNFDEGFLAANAEYKDESFGGSHLSSETTAEEEVQLEKSPITEEIFSKEETITKPGLLISTEEQLDLDKSEDYDLLNIPKSTMSGEVLNEIEDEAAQTEDVHQIASSSEGVSEDGNHCSVESAGPKETGDKSKTFELLNLESDPDTYGADTALVQGYKKEHQEEDKKLVDEQLVSPQTDITVSVEDVTAIDSQLIGNRRKLGSSRRTKGRRQINDESKQDEISEQVNIPGKATETPHTESALKEQGPETAVDTGSLDEQQAEQHEVTESSMQSVHDKPLETVNVIMPDKISNNNMIAQWGETSNTTKTPQEHPDSVVFERPEEDTILSKELDGGLFSIKTIETTAFYKDEDQEEEVKLSDEEPSEAGKAITPEQDTTALRASPQTDNTSSVEDVTATDSKQGEISEEVDIPDRTIETTKTEFVVEENNPAVDTGIFDKQESGQEGDNSSVEVHDESFVALEDTSLKTTDMTAVFEAVLQEQTKGNDKSEQVAGDQSNIAKMPHEQELLTEEGDFTEKTKVDSQPKIYLKPKEQINVHQITFLSDNEMHEDMDNVTEQPVHGKPIGEPAEIVQTFQTEIKAVDTDPRLSRRKLASSRRTKDRKPASDLVIDVSENSSTGNGDMSSSGNKDDAEVTQFVQINPHEVYGHNLAKEVLTEAIKKKNNAKPQDAKSATATENSTINDKQEFFSSSDKEQTTDFVPCNQNVPHQEAISPISKKEDGFDQEKDTKVQVVLSNDKPINEEMQKEDTVLEIDSFTSKNLNENVDAGAQSTISQNETTTESEEVVRADLFDATQICAMSHAEDIAEDQQVTEDMDVLEAGAKLQIASEQKRRKMGSTRRSQLNKKQDKERSINTEDNEGVCENPKVTDEVISTENEDAKSLQKDTFEKQQEITKAANTITVELHSQEGKEMPEFEQEGMNEEAASVVDMAATQNLQLVTGDEIQPSSPGKRKKMGSTRKNLRSKQESSQDEQEKDKTVENVENTAVASITEENNESKDSGLLLHAVPKQQNDEADLGQQHSKEKLNSEFTVQEADMSSKSDAMTEEVARRRKMGSHRKPHTDQSKKQDVYNDIAIEESVIQPLREHKDDSSKLEQTSQVKESSDKALPTLSAFDIKVESKPVSEKPSEQPLLSTNVHLAPESRIRLSSGFGQRASLGSSRYEVVMIGDSSVGKTSFMKRAQSGKFSLDLPASVGLDSYIWTVMVDGKPVALHLWDTAGQERFHSMTKQIFHRAQAFLLMYDVTCGQSFAAVSYWANCIKEGAAENVVILLLGNKSDCKDRKVARDDGEILAQEHNFAFMECSAATGENVMESLETVARLLNQKAAARREEPLVLRKPVSRNKPGCC